MTPTSRIIYHRDGTKTYEICGREVTEAEWEAQQVSLLDDLLESGETLMGQSTTTWPQRSESMAVHPKQVDQANERARKHGIAAVYDKTGTPSVASANDKRKLMKLEGFYDKNAFS